MNVSGIVSQDHFSFAGIRLLSLGKSGFSSKLVLGSCAFSGCAASDYKELVSGAFAACLEGGGAVELYSKAEALRFNSRLSSADLSHSATPRYVSILLITGGPSCRKIAPKIIAAFTCLIRKYLQSLRGRSDSSQIS